jgi:hypothetical protein
MLSLLNGALPSHPIPSSLLADGTQSETLPQVKKGKKVPSSWVFPYIKLIHFQFNIVQKKGPPSIPSSKRTSSIKPP